MSAPTITDPNLTPLAMPPNQAGDPYRIGWRDLFHARPDGTTEHVQIPLTAEDTLHPREGDVIVESKLNFFLRLYLASVFEMVLEKKDPNALVLSDTGIYWDDPTLEHHSPDIAVILGVREKRENWESFFVAEHGVRPRLIIEIVSPSTRANDVVTKFEEYHRARVANYVIVDRESDGPWKLRGFQHTSSKYLPMPTDELGRLWIEAVGVWLGLKNNRVVCYDGVTGEEISDFKGSHAATALEKARADAERARADAAEKRLRELEAQLGRTTLPE